MDDQNKNLILATALSFAVILVWFLLFPPPEPVEDPNAVTPTETTTDPSGAPIASTPQAATGDPADAAPAPAPENADAPRLSIESDTVTGAISLLGGRIDQLSLKNYREELAQDSDIVTMLAPVGSANAYYALYGWAPGSGLSPEMVPGPNTMWQAEPGQTLAPGSPVSMTWDNGRGLVFTRQIALDNNYMFTVTQTVQNTGSDTAALAPYGILARHGEPQDLKNFFILHEGMIAMADGELTETDYDDLDPATNYKDITVEQSGWIGFTDHYWMSTMIPSEGTAVRLNAFHDTERDIYQTTMRQPTQTLAPGASVAVTSQMFAGPKEWDTIRNYEAGEELDNFGDSLMYGLGLKSALPGGIDGFIDSIDWGWFFFLTKPIFFLLHELNIVIGNMGWAIIALTLIIKAVVFPLAYKSYASMAKMKELQPKMEELKERAGDDRQKLQQEMMALYKKEKVNPASGCLPILLQIPIFFSLYKVIFVTLELRHAPFIGWIRDLSAPDPSSLYNLFGLLPWDAPDPQSFVALIFIGVLPILLGVTMWLQQKLNPAPTDPTQKMIFAWMPWVFMFMLGGFASGLVIYWIANNTITFIQQYLIMRRHGYKPDVFGNIRASFNRSGSDKAK
ncbi:membrane protein insertase YidC [Lutimaribacter sp. EGI FJ00015]|uniref:Membrane protein insertase YidC n=1 Tax=Lutimaribacter degradans TaxID=2945989 RepID=A0ACC5ZYU7_9RHOB|nr:membrane protein insertase YidC [Lutimaribacter sp. EGI FJ00013]MCM2563232.1 membrane protein insertase YidC [Lutimaribacter sp. EGI FJ00013]MCO0614445.1 membrane protein insertase YidC [Lutimaribacter sp. EGI FJ00015]MCO0635954.1 membrane protein insertase YidC [Lutimaribacter sp. EGI FJ00014]